MNLSYKDLPKKGTFRDKINLKDCIPKYIKFKTKELQDLLKEIKSTVLYKDDSFKKEFVFDSIKYVMAEGGLHSTNKDQFFKASNTYYLEDEDVGLNWLN